jgi:arsenical pump membrane protein
MFVRRPVWERVVLVCGVAAGAAAFVGGGSKAVRALAQGWPPFALVAGLLAIGHLANEDGFFDWLGFRIASVPGSHRRHVLYSLFLVAAVTVVFNLDTSVVFLTPTVVSVARRRGISTEPFLYGVVMMSNSASLLLPGSNLTNLLVLGHGTLTGRDFAVRMAPAWAAAVAATLAVIVLSRPKPTPVDVPYDDATPSLRFGEGVIGAAVATALILGLRSPALPVLVVGVLALGVRYVRGRLDVEAMTEHLDMTVIAGIFGLVLALGTLARVWSGPSAFMHRSGGLETTGIGLLSSVLVNNLPAAMLLTARHVLHPRALLIGLNIGPNLAVTGSLSAVLWFRAATSVRAEPSIATYSRYGLMVAPIAAASASAALIVFSGGRF